MLILLVILQYYLVILMTHRLIDGVILELSRLYKKYAYENIAKF